MHGTEQKRHFFTADETRRKLYGMLPDFCSEEFTKAFPSNVHRFRVSVSEVTTKTTASEPPAMSSFNQANLKSVTAELSHPFRSQPNA